MRATRRRRMPDNATPADAGACGAGAASHLGARLSAYSALRLAENKNNNSRECHNCLPTLTQARRHRRRQPRCVLSCPISGVPFLPRLVSRPLLYVSHREASKWLPGMLQLDACEDAEERLPLPVHPLTPPLLEGPCAWVFLLLFCTLRRLCVGTPVEAMTSSWATFSRGTCNHTSAIHVPFDPFGIGQISPVPPHVALLLMMRLKICFLYRINVFLALRPLRNSL